MWIKNCRMGLGVVSLLLLVQPLVADDQKQYKGKPVILREIAPAYAQTSINTTIFRANSVQTHRRHQYVSFYNEDGHVVVACRRLNDDCWTIAETPYQGNCKDAHNVISMAVDGKGYIHLAFNHHGHPLNYCKSVAPESLQFGPLQSMLGASLDERTKYDESNVTYPEFYRLSNGDLIAAYRSGSSGRGNLVLNKYDVRKAEWSRLQDVLLDGEGQRNAYWQIYVDKQDVIHLSWVWRETWLVETNHDMCYACSTDGGKTWQKTSGERYELPIKASNAEYAWRIPQGRELINQTSMTADKDGHPYIATYWRDSDSNVPQYRMVWYDGESWQQMQVGDRHQPFSLSGGGTKMIPIARPRMVVNDKQEAFYLFRDEERGSKVSLAYCPCLANPTWIIRDLTDFSVDAWEPTIDTELWKRKRQLHIFVQHTAQGDGERTKDLPAQPVFILEY